MGLRAPLRLREPPAPGSARADAAIAMGVFAGGFALSVLFDFGRRMGTLFTQPTLAHVQAHPLLFALGGACVAVLLRPTAIARLVVLCALLAAYLFQIAPDYFNHSVLAMAIALALPAAVVAARPWQGGDVHRRLYARGAPVLRVSLLVLYGWAALHKVNWDYFDPGVSCATVQVFQLKDRIPWLPVPAWSLWPAIYGALLIELLLPLGLAFPRWRRHAIALGCLFHLPLALHYPGFSVMLFALYSLFMPRELVAQAYDEARLRISPRVRRAWGHPLGQALAWIAICGAAVVFFGNKAFGDHRRPDLAFLLLSFAAAFYFLRLYGARGWVPPESLVAGPSRALWVVPVLLFAIGWMPHLGIKSTQSFAMFSNLRTEGGQSNHLLIPAAVQRFDTLRDLVRIEAANDAYLDRLVRPARGDAGMALLMPRSYKRARLADLSPRQFWLPYASLRTHVTGLAQMRVGRIQVAYARDGERHVVDHAQRSELAQAPWWHRKTMKLRPVALDGPALCMW